MAKYIAHASIDERGKISGGKAGDQTAKELCIRTFYTKPWQYVLRIKNEKVRIQFGNEMIDAVNNENIGYNQYKRNTLLTEAIKADFDLTKIKNKCETDCSALITVCYLSAVYKVLGKTEYQKAYKIMFGGSNCCTTRNLRSRMNKLDVITVYTGSAYLGGTDNSLFGDIYLKEGSHVVAYVDDGKKIVKNSSEAVSSSKKETIKVDGVWGESTTRLAQVVFKTTIDGKISNQYSTYKKNNPGLLASTFEWEKNPGKNGSELIKAIQKWCGAKQDGFIGTSTIKLMQKKLGTVQDGKVSKPSSMVKAFQRWLNSQV